MKDFFEQIEDYLEGRLSEEDKVTFEKEMSQNPQLKQAVNDYDILGMIGDALIEEEVKKSVEQVLEEEDRKTEYRKYIKWIIAIVALCLIGLIGKQYLIPPPQPSYADLFIETEWPTPERGNEIDTIVLATDLHLQGKTDSAVYLLNELNTLKAFFWITEIYSNPMQADSVLKYAPNFVKDKVYRDRVNFLKILAFYSQGAKDQYMKLINNLPEDTDPLYLEKYKLIDSE